MASSALKLEGWDDPQTGAASASGALASFPSTPESLGAFPKFRSLYEAGAPEVWQMKAVKKLTELYSLESGWDGNGAPAISMSAGMFGLTVLQQVMLPRTPIPEIVPSSSGGVQFEWHEGGIDLELHISAPYECELWFDDHRSGLEPVSIELSNDFSELQTALRTLSKR